MIRDIARLAHPIAAAAFLGCGIVQVFLAGLGVFDDPRASSPREFGYLFGWLTLVVLVLALVGREPRRITGFSALLLGQFALQSLFVAVRADMPAVAALHPLNGFAILAVAEIRGQGFLGRPPRAGRCAWGRGGLRQARPASPQAG